MRDLVIGVTVVLPDGLRASSGGKVVKNVAGYDLGKLFCGSRGRLGQVERVALRLHPLPAAARTVVARRRPLAASCTTRSSCRARSTSRTARRTSSSRARGARSTRQAATLGGEEADPWAELRELQAGAARPRALGRRARRRSSGRARASPTGRSASSSRGARSPSASWRRCAARADRRLRPLRLLPADVPDLHALARGDGLAARADPPDGRPRRRHDRAHRHGRRALRPLPRLHGVRARVPVGRQVRPADRADARLRRGAPPALGRRAAAARRRSSPSSRTAGACAPRSRCAACRRPARSGRWPPSRRRGSSPAWPPEHLPGAGPARRAARRLRAERRLRRRQRRDGPRPRRRRLRRARAAGAGLLRRAARARRPLDGGRRPRARARASARRLRLHRHERRRLRLAPEGSRRRERRRRLGAARQPASAQPSAIRSSCGSPSRTRAT